MPEQAKSEEKRWKGGVLDDTANNEPAEYVRYFGLRTPQYERAQFSVGVWTAPIHRVIVVIGDMSIVLTPSQAHAMARTIADRAEQARHDSWDHWFKESTINLTEVPDDEA